MSGAATITAEPVRLSEYRSAGATISEYDYQTIDFNFRRPQSSAAPIWLAEVLEEIDELGQLPNGWDSYGADPPGAELVLAARSFIRDAVYSDGALPRPSVVTATRSGGIQLEWGCHDGAYFELEYVSHDTAHYFFNDNRLGIEEEGVVRAGDSLDQMIRYISRAQYDSSF